MSSDSITLKMYRYQEIGDATKSVLQVPDLGTFFILEDKQRSEKIQNETAIPAGTYPVRLKKVLTPMTQKYRLKFDWFSWFLELFGVPGFTDVYIHIGNSAKDTSGCLLVGNATNCIHASVEFSAFAFERLYRHLQTKLEAGTPVFIEIQNLI